MSISTCSPSLGLTLAVENNPSVMRLDSLCTPVKTKTKWRFKEKLGEEIGGELLSSTSLQGIQEGMIQEQAFKEEEGDFKKAFSSGCLFVASKNGEI